MTRGARWVGGIIVLIIIAAIIAIAATHKNNDKANNSSAGTTGNTSQASKKPTVSNSIIQTKTDPVLGQYLADPSGKPLYTYGADTANASNCTGSCLTTWPPYLATSTTQLPSGITTFKRSDTGAMQFAYNGMPLYYFASDSSGKVTGNGVDNFQIAKPSSSASQTNGSPSSSSSTGYPY